MKITEKNLKIMQLNFLKLSFFLFLVNVVEIEIFRVSSIICLMAYFIKFVLDKERIIQINGWKSKS